MVNKGGRPTKFPDSQMSAVRKLVLMGATDEDLAEAFDVTKQTVNNWKKKRPEFFDSLKDWKLEADSKVEQSLYQRAIGCTTRQTKFAPKDPDDLDAGLIPVEIIDKENPPDATSTIFWLKNRKPSEWRDKQPDDTATADDLAAALSAIADRLPT